MAGLDLVRHPATWFAVSTVCPSLAVVPSYEAALLSLIEPVTVPLWTFLVWRNHPTYRPPDWWTLVGGGIILVGFAYRYWPRNANRNAAPPEAEPPAAAS